MHIRFIEWLKEVLNKIPHPFRWLIIVHLGFIFVILGIVMLVVPGPGILFIILGLTILSFEFAWANEAVKNGQQGLEKIIERIKNWFLNK